MGTIATNGSETSLFKNKLIETLQNNSCHFAILTALAKIKCSVFKLVTQPICN